MIRIKATVDAQDLDRVTAALDPRALDQLLITAFRDALNPVVNLARGLAPRRTGRLARGIQLRVQRRGGLQVSISSRAPYGHLIEFGHRMVTRGRAKREVSFIAARPFARPAFEQLAPEVEAALSATMEAGIAQAARGGAWRAR